MTGIAAIAPLPAGGVRPFWSVMIPTYNPHPDYLGQTIAAVLAQDPGPVEMEIGVIDDGSTSVDVRALVRHAAGDRVSWFRQEPHAGIARNWNTCVRRARGRWVHILHQDDLVLPGFYERLRAGISACPAAGAAFCRDIVIGERGEQQSLQPLVREAAGVVEDWIEHVFVGLHLRCPALAVRRGVYEALGGFREDLDYVLDWDMWKRIAAAYPMWYEPEALACYRRHPRSESFNFIRTGANIAEIRRSIELSDALLPPSIAASVSARTRQNYTGYAVMMAWRSLLDRDPAASFAQLREARKLTSTLSVLMAIGRFIPRARGLAR